MSLVVATTHRGFQLTEKICRTSQIRHRLRSRVFGMHSTDGTSGGYYMSPQKKKQPLFPFHTSLHWCTCTQSCWMFVAQISLLFFLPSSTHVRGFSLFLWYIPCYLPPNYFGLKCLNNCVNQRAVVQWLRLAPSKGPNWVGVFFPHPPHLPEDGNTSSFRNVVFLETPDDG
jgi:hypothetical protein